MQSNIAKNAFDVLVGLKYELYNGLFLTLPFPFLEEVGIKLPIFAERCRLSLAQQLPPSQILESFFRDIFQTDNFEKQMDVLFLFSQFMERQVVLFDALEQAAFARTQAAGQAGSLSYLLERVKERGLRQKLPSALEHYRTRVVLTAHPTQFYPESVLGIINAFADAIKHDDLLSIEQILLQLGMTSFRNKDAPTPLSEADNLLNRARSVFYESMIDLEKLLDDGLHHQRPNHPMLELGFWPGGDRDGNPYVDVATTLQVAEELRQCAISHYRDELDKLKQRLTFPGMAEKLACIENRLEQYESPEELLDELDTLYHHIVNNHQGLFSEHVQRFQLAVRTFGFYFASLDLRQDSSVHEEVVAALLKKLGPSNNWPKECASYANLNSEEKTRLLETLCSETLQSDDAISLDDHPLAEDLIGSLRAIAAIQKSNGAQGLHRYIISHAQGAQHVLEIYFLAQLLGLRDLPLDIVPLFETVNDLKHSDQVMKRLYLSPVYQQHLDRRGGKQIVMVGFSDGTKDGGYLTCNWEIFKSKQRLEQLSSKHGVDIVFFDGRGGPPARGGGNTHKFYRALGASLTQREVQLTIQGQTVSSAFGTTESAFFNLEQIFTAGLEAKLFDEQNNRLEKRDTDLLDALSNQSYQAYMELRNDPVFLHFLEEMTPLKYFEKLNVASRPAKRGSKKELRLDDLRAIPFVGAWSQIRLNLPGYYGLGTALKWAFDTGKGEEVKRLYQEKLFFSTLINNAMQALVKSNELFTAHLLEDSAHGAFVSKLHKELGNTRQFLLEVSDQEELMETDPLNRRSIEMRERLILPLVVIQQYAMSELRKTDHDEKKKIYEKLLLKTLPPITNASRNSA